MEDLLIKVEKINKYFPGVHALKNVDFDLKAGEVHALLGENGAGKSTLIKILGGMFCAEGGKIFLNGKEVVFADPKSALESGISIIYQELQLSLHLSIAENIFFGRLKTNKLGFINRKELNEDARKILERVGLKVNPNTKVKFLSTAQQQLLEIAKALSTNAKVIIMDEPTSALSSKEIKILFNIVRELKQNGIGIIYVSHKLEELYEVCDRVTVFRDGQSIETMNVADTTADQLIRAMVGRKIISKLERKNVSGDETILNVQNISTNKITNVSFDVKKGEIVGFSGLMGAGKTEVARALFGIDPLTEGSIEFGEKKHTKFIPQDCAQWGIGYVPEDRKLSGLFVNLSVRDNISSATIKQDMKGRFVSKELQKKSVQRSIDSLSIKTPSQMQKMRNLSGGNQQKCILGRWMLHQNLKILVVDEPTRGIDVGAKQEIYSILDEMSQKGITIIIMSSEMPELITMCDRIIVMRQGTVCGMLMKDEISQESMMQMAVR